MKKIGKILLVFMMIFSAISLQKNVYAYNEPLRFELLPLVQDTDVSSISNYSSVYSEDEARNIIGQRLKKAYLNGDSEISIEDLNLSKDKRKFISCLGYYFPFLSNGAELDKVAYRNNILTKLYITNTMTIDETKKYFDAVDQEVSSIISLISPSMDDVMKALTIHDYFANYCKYQIDGFDDDSFRSGGIIYRKEGVCQAYAYAYQYILNQFGIECYIVSSDSMNHAWNIVEINRRYYHVDVTWDDPVLDEFGRVGHQYFLLSDEEIKNKNHHDWDRTDLKCDDKKYDVYYWNNVTSPIVYDGENIFFARDDGIYRRNSKTQNETLIKKSDRWKVLGSTNGYWGGNFSGLFMKNHKLYYNSSTQIRCMDENGENDKEIYTPDTSEGYVYGIRYNNNYIEYAIQKEPLVEEQVLFRVAMPVDITQITLPSHLELGVGFAKKLDYSILPVDYTEKVTWSSDNPEIVEVDQEGNIQCKSLGNAIITVTSESGLSSQCQIQVIDKLKGLGDVNEDGKVDFLDAITVLRYDAEIIQLTDDQMRVAEVNKDGKVDFLDAIMILRYDAEIIDRFN